MNPSIKDLVKDQTACFSYYRAGIVYYQVELDMPENKGIYRFPIPLEDVGDGVLNMCEKAITLMRWIRKAIENNELYYEK